MKHYKKVVALAIIALTIVGFIYYFVAHPNTLDPLKNLSAINIALILFLYFLVLLILVFILKVSLALYEKHIDNLENLQLNIWSNIVNFFGPLQSGPGVRALYLKKKHGLNLRKFLYVSLIYYAFIAVVSCILIGIGSFAWYIALSFIILCLGSLYLGFIIMTKKINTEDKPKLKFKLIGLLFLITLAQLLITSLIYLIELKIVNKSINYNQVMTYTGVANLALFVSITPGAIGFRESFLLFTQRLHHIRASNIISASLIDRSVYLVFLFILILVAASMHIGNKIKSTKE